MASVLMAILPLTLLFLGGTVLPVAWMSRVTEPRRMPMGELLWLGGGSTGLLAAFALVIVTNLARSDSLSWLRGAMLALFVVATFAGFVITSIAGWIYGGLPTENTWRNVIGWVVSIAWILFLAPFLLGIIMMGLQVDW